MMRSKAIRLVLASYTFILLAQENSRVDDERAIRKVIQQRETAWNLGDVAAYGRLLTEDADLLSATGRPAQGRKAILDLYMEQRAGTYEGGTTATPVESVRFISKDVAIVNSHFQLIGLHAKDGAALGVRRGLLTLVVVKRDRNWLITCMRGIPETPIR